MGTVWQVVLAYVAIALTWILLSDQLLLWLGFGLQEQARWQTAKGVGFVLFTAGLLWLLLHRHYRIQTRHLAYVRLQESAFKALFMNVPLPMWVYDLHNYKFLEVNEAAQAKYGYTREQFLKLSLFDIRPPTDTKRLQQDLSNPRPQLQHSGVWQHRLSSGQLREVEITSHTLNYQDKPAVLVLANDVTERLAAERELARREHLYRTLASNLPKGVVFLFDQDLRFLVVEGQGLEEAGLQREQIEGRTLYEVLPQDSVNRLEPLYRKALAGESSTAESQWGPLYYQIYVLPVRDPTGAVWAGLAVGYNVTEVKKAEEEARRAKERLEALINASPLPIISLSPRWLVESWNPAAENTFGYTTQEVLGRFPPIIPTDSIEQAKRYMEQASQQSIGGLELERMHKNGQSLTVKLFSAPIHNNQGQTEQIMAIIEDITEQKRNRDLLRQQAERLTLLHQLDGDILSASDPKQVAPLSLAQLIKALDCDRAVLCSRSALGDTCEPLADVAPTPVQPVDLQQASQSLQQQGYHVVASLPLAVEQQVLGRLLLARQAPQTLNAQSLEVAQEYANHLAILLWRAQLQQQLAEYIELLEQKVAERTADLEAFAYSVSHDLRSPLRAMRGFAEALEEDFGASLADTAKDYLKRIIRASDHLDRLILDLLAYSRLSYRDLPLGVVNLNQAVENALSGLSAELRQTQARLEVQADLGQVKAHHATLVQAIGNLVSNAIKFVAPGQRPQVQLSSQDLGTNVRLWVKDNGIGISPERFEQIFKPFERLHGLSEYPGNGIGLAIVKKGIERMGGKVGVESSQQGSCFFMDLPKGAA